ncbi:hypothetical protein GCM10010166_62890 [Couchioplanes caeruleus subsp. azureus]|nr:hypothetical protein GCM10010166_62890 [Couchioplanes caeruleus subsp. azureus]
MVAVCPQWRHELTALTSLHPFAVGPPGGTPPRRPELWWECARCGWLGYQNRAGEPLRAMRRLEGKWADCDFCGEEESNVASRVWQEADGELRDWVVCLFCGTSNARRVGHIDRGIDPEA